MEQIGIIASMIAAVAAIATLWFSVRTSRGNILKRIDRKEEQIRNIDHKLDLLFGLNRGTGGPITPLVEKRRRLQERVKQLRRKL